MEYKLLTSYSADLLSKDVNKHLKEGWKLHGNTNGQTVEDWGHFTKLGESVKYSQAVVKE